jgi:hypothetical protein
MLKAYAVALVLSKSTNVFVNSVDVEKLLENTMSLTTNFVKPGSIKD